MIMGSPKHYRSYRLQFRSEDVWPATDESLEGRSCSGCPSEEYVHTCPCVAVNSSIWVLSSHNLSLSYGANASCRQSNAALHSKKIIIYGDHGRCHYYYNNLIIQEKTRGRPDIIGGMWVCVRTVLRVVLIKKRGINQ